MRCTRVGTSICSRPRIRTVNRRTSKHCYVHGEWYSSLCSTTVASSHRNSAPPTVRRETATCREYEKAANTNITLQDDLTNMQKLRTNWTTLTQLYYDLYYFKNSSFLVYLKVFNIQQIHFDFRTVVVWSLFWWNCVICVFLLSIKIASTRLNNAIDGVIAEGFFHSFRDETSRHVLCPFSGFCVMHTSCLGMLSTSTLHYLFYMLPYSPIDQ